jgi:single-strand DNA-binding protein
MSSVNLAVLAGSLLKQAEARLLPDGSTVWELDLAVQPTGRATAAVPVSWVAPATGADPAAWTPGEELLVVGAVRRRFYRSGGATVSRTDVLAQAVVTARQRTRVAPLVAEALAPLWTVEPVAARRRGDRLRTHG